MHELNDKLESLGYRNNFWRNEHYAIARCESWDRDWSTVIVTYSIFLGHHLPISTISTTFIDGEYIKTEISTIKPITPEEIKLKILMI